MIEIILHDICDTFPYLKYGLAAAVCTALALTVLNHSRIMDKEKRSNYVSLLGKSMFLAFYGAVLLQVTLLSREPGSRTAADLIPFSTWGTTAQSRAHEIENMIMFLPVGVFLPMLHRGLREFRTAVLVLTGLSAGIELIQFVTQRGYLQTDDVIMNVLGGGWIYILAIDFQMEEIAYEKHNITDYGSRYRLTLRRRNQAIGAGGIT